MQQLGRTAAYRGQVRACVKQGSGQYDYPGGVFRYEGPWEDGKKHGSGGKFTLLGGATYEGDFLHGEMTGKGTKSWADGRTYTGDFVAGELSGKGVWKSADGKEVYEGDFLDNHREGQGFNRMTNGDTYNGEFSCHRFHGSGSYLRENCFVVTSTFKKGILDGRGEISWHKVGSYEGDIVSGRLNGRGQFTSFDGSYKYQGDFEENIPTYKVKSLNLYVDKSFILNNAEEDPKGKKKAAKPKKGDPSADAIATVSAGHEIGKLIYLMSTDADVDMGEHANEWKVPLTIPNPAEQRRSMRIRLREYCPPPPPGKGQPVPEPDPDTELGAIIPLWQRVATLETKSSAWDRFPVTDSIRYIDGVNILTGEQVSVEGATESFTKDILGVNSSAISQSSDSSVSITFVPSSLRNADERLLLITDFRLSLQASTNFVCTDINGTEYQEIPILSLCNKVEDLEGKSRLELVLLKPSTVPFTVDMSDQVQCEQEGSGDETQQEKVPLASPWAECRWELHLCEEVELPPEEDCEATENNSEELDETENSVAPIPPKIEMKKTVLCRWADSVEFDSSSWHSIALTLQHSSSGSDRSELCGNVELTVDGTGRMKVDGPFEEGVAAAWLPSTKLETETSEESDDVDNSVAMVFRVGKGEYFGGAVKSLVLVAGHHGSAQDMTSAFVVEEIKIEETNESNDMDDGSSVEEDSGPIVPHDCSVVQEIEMMTCGGRGSVDGLFIPAGTPHGTYVLEVFDNVDQQCLQTASTGPEIEIEEDSEKDISDRATDVDNTQPGDVASFCRLVPPAGSSLMTFKIVVHD